jgi:hypothetical protein
MTDEFTVEDVKRFGRLLRRWAENSDRDFRFWRNSYTDRFWLRIGEEGGSSYCYTWCGDSKTDVFRKAAETLFGLPEFGNSVEEFELLLESRG